MVYNNKIPADISWNIYPMVLYLYIFMGINSIVKIMGTRRKQGHKYGNDHTKNQILLVLCGYLEGIEEPVLFDIIKKRLGISEIKGFKAHLSDLKDQKILLKDKQDGKANIWRIKPEALPVLARKFLGNTDELAFHSSAYCQAMIAKVVKQNWLFVKDEDLKDLDLKGIPAEEYLKGYIKDFDLKLLLEKSPSALKTALAPPEDKKHFVALMLINLISDSIKYNIPLNLFFDISVIVEAHRLRINKRVRGSIYGIPPELSKN